MGGGEEGVAGERREEEERGKGEGEREVILMGTVFEYCSKYPHPHKLLTFAPPHAYVYYHSGIPLKRHP